MGARISGISGMIEELLAAAFRTRKKADPPPSSGSQEGFVIGTALEFPGSPHAEGSPFAIPASHCGRHSVSFGSSGMGKSNLMALRAARAALNGTTGFALDFLGDASDAAVSRLASEPRKAGDTVLIDLRSEDRVPSLNFLAGPGGPHLRAASMLAALRSEADGWGVRINMNMLAALVALAETGHSIAELRPLFALEPAFREHVLSAASDREAIAVLTDFHRSAPPLQSQMWAEIANKLTPYSYDPHLFLALSGAGAPDVAAMLDTEGRSTLVALGVSRRPAAIVAGKLLLAEIERLVMARADLPEGARNGVEIFIDEASRVAGFGLERLLAEARRFRCVLHLALQFTGQSEKALADAIRANCSTIVIFGGGSAEAAELAPEVVSSLPRDRVRDEIMRLGVGECIVTMKGLPSAKVRLLRAPEPTAKPREVAVLRAAAEELAGVTVEEARAEMSRRDAWVRGLSGRPADVPRAQGRRRPRSWEGGDA